MSSDYLIIGSFQYVDDVLQALKCLRERRISSFEVFSPVPDHQLEEEIYRNKPRSPVRYLTLLGGVTGCLTGFLMTCWMSLDWPLRTSAKTILSFPAFVIIGFECTILLGACFTLLAIFLFCRLPSLVRSSGYKGTFANNIFGLTVRVPKEQSEAIRNDLKGCGAEEVEVKYVR